MKPDLMACLDARTFAKSRGIGTVERGDSFTFGRRLEYNRRANTWLDLKTGEYGALKGTLIELLGKFFPQLAEQKGGAR